MPSSEPSKVAIQLIKERSRDALVEGLDTTLAGMKHDEAMSFLADLILAMGADRDHLKARLAALLATKFGRSSEKSSADQLDLFAEALRIVEGDTSSDEPSGEAADEPEPDPTVVASRLIEQTNAEVTALAAQQRQQRKAEREARRAARELARAQGDGEATWPTHLPIRKVYLELPEGQRICGDSDCELERKIIRHETSWRIEYKTAAEVVVTYLPVAACPSHHGGPVSVPAPPKPVDKGRIGFSLAAHLLWLRITHNLPVRRIAEMMQSEGVPVTEQMIHTLICTTGERARPLAAAILAPQDHGHRRGLRQHEGDSPEQVGPKILHPSPSGPALIAALANARYQAQ